MCFQFCHSNFHILQRRKTVYVTSPAALTGDESRADDDVHVLTLLGKQLHLRLDELLGHFLGVAALALSRLLDVHLQRLGTQRLELLQGCGPVGEEGDGERGGVFLVKLGREHTLQQTIFSQPKVSRVFTLRIKTETSESI